jgi:hypothetical protein
MGHISDAEKRIKSQILLNYVSEPNERKRVLFQKSNRSTGQEILPL